MLVCWWYTAVVARDFQRSRVYQWGALFTLPCLHQLSRLRSERSCVKIIERACSLYGVPSCPVVFKTPRHQKCAYYYPDGGYISLPPHMMRADIAVHEAAHHIVNHLWPRSTDHGPVFVRVYMCLMHRLYGLEMSWLRASARASGVRWAGVKYDAPLSELK